MDTTEIWQSPVQDKSVRDDLRLNQARYLRIVSRVYWLNERYLQILGAAGLTVMAFFMAGISPYRPYSYIWAVILVAVQWYVFSLYERLRARIKADADESDPLAYFSRKLDIITLISKIRKMTIIIAGFLVTMSWIGRTPEQLFNQNTLILGITVIVMMIAVIIHYRGCSRNL
jgi:hypothetical protein